MAQSLAARSLSRSHPAFIVFCALSACTSSPERTTGSTPIVDVPAPSPIAMLDASSEPPPRTAPPLAQTDASTADLDAEIAMPDCEGFPLRGLKHSPGGSVLPNKCMPFHPTRNNPYAVRCIDALPEFDSGFPGDEACILPPPPGQGIQLGLHPQGHSDRYWAQIHAGDLSGYASSPAEFVQSSGVETTRNYRERVAGAVDAAYYRIYFRLRTGGHHTIATLHDTDEPDGWVPGEDELPGFASEIFSLVANLGGQQRMDENVPSTLDKPEEDQGLYLRWPERAQAIINYHGFNASDGPLLRESWINVWWEEDRRTLAQWFLGYELPQLLTLDVSPGATRDYHYAMGLREATRLISLMGHRHAWTSNMSAWIERASGGIGVVYRSLDWSDIPTYRYDSLAINPPITSQVSDGAASGITLLQPGDALHFNCHIEYTAERASRVGAPRTPEEAGSLKFANEVYDGEMCVLFGIVTGDPFLSFPVLDPTPPPAFATVD